MKKVLIVFLLFLSSAYFLFNLHNYLKNSLQMDFSAFYTAGESLRHGLNPYRNNIDKGIWDGVDRFEHSRFLYPPIVAYLFIPLTFFGYFFGKSFWLIFNLFLMAIILKKLSNKIFLLSLTFPLLFYPGLSFFERGQIDVITLFFIVFSLFLFSNKKPLLSGLFLSIATIFKLHIILIFPFLIMKRKWKMTSSYLVSLFIFIFIPFLINQKLSVNYFTKELPRISKYGEQGTDSMMIKNLKLFPVSFDKGGTIKDGRIYQWTTFSFISNASLSRAVNLSLNAKNLNNIASYKIQIFIYFLLFSLAAINSYKNKDENIYWFLALLTILLSSPLTWSMNLIWLIIIFPWVFKNFKSEINIILPLSFVVLGLVYAAIPDYLLVKDPALYSQFPYNMKYIIAELLIFFGLIFYQHLSSSKKFTDHIS